MVRIMRDLCTRGQLRLQEQQLGRDWPDCSAMQGHQQLGSSGAIQTRPYAGTSLQHKWSSRLMRLQAPGTALLRKRSGLCAQKSSKSLPWATLIAEFA